MTYWWSERASERYWVEIRWQDGTGTELSSSDKANAWYQLLDDVKVDDIIYHWNADDHVFVGRSEVADVCRIVAGERRVPLKNFRALPPTITLDVVRANKSRLTAIRDQVATEFPKVGHFLPFQFRRDGLRMMSNYFTKLPEAAVPVLFDHTGVGEGDADPPDPSDGPIDERTARTAKVGFLPPFKRKKDGQYISFVQGGVQRKGRTHETLVNDFAQWLEDRGCTNLGCNSAIDLGMAKPPLVVEAKIVNGNWKSATRQAVGQLYEYRYFEVVDPKAALIFLASEAVPPKWLKYLESDRGIGVAWRTSLGFELSKLARSDLQPAYRRGK